jgi:hypothetical protein
LVSPVFHNFWFILFYLKTTPAKAASSLHDYSPHTKHHQEHHDRTDNQYPDDAIKGESNELHHEWHDLLSQIFSDSSPGHFNIY